MKKRVWINLHESEVDFSYIVNSLESAGIEVISCGIGQDLAKTIEMGKTVDAVVSIAEPWNEETLTAVKGKLEFIQRYGTGIDNVDVDYATKMGIAVANLPGLNAESVAELFLGHVLNAYRKISYCVEKCRKGEWDKEFSGYEIEGKTIGLLGFGFIPKKIVQILSGFNINYIVYDPFISDETKKLYSNIIFAGHIEEVFKSSDIVSVHIPSSKETRGMVNYGMLSLMQKHALFINLARGELVVESDLVRVLQEKKIAGACLDVLNDEPPSKDNPLLPMDNVFITPHKGAGTVESEIRSQVYITDSIIRFFEGKEIKSIKNPDFINFKLGGIK